MSFVKKIISNRYRHNIVKSGEYFYVFANEIVDSLAEFFVITQFNLEGELIWEKRINSNYMTNSNYNLLLGGLLPLDNNGILIIGYHGNLCLLSRMDEFGNVIWSKLFDFGGEGYGNSYDPYKCNILIEEYDFILHIPYNVQGSSFTYHHRILKFDFSGQLLFNKKFNSNSNSSYFDKIHKNANNYYISSGNTIIEFDQSLNITSVSNALINNHNNISVTDFFWDSNDELILIGVFTDENENRSFDFCSSLKTNHSSRYNTLLLERTNDGNSALAYHSNITFGNDFFYIIDTKSILARNLSNEVENNIYKYDINFNLIWSKSYSDENAYNFQQTYIENNILIHYSDFTFGIVDTEFNSCNTESIVFDPEPINANISLDTVTDFSTQYVITDENDFIFISDQQLTIENINDIEIQNICFDGPILDNHTLLQSPYFNVFAVGSNGEDSPESVQLRWIFGGDLGDKHLPKGNAASNTINYNKPNDFVKIYRTPYQETLFLFNFAESLSSVNNEKSYWIYKYPDSESPVDLGDTYSKVFYVYFRNKEKYDEVLLTINPLADPIAFITAYGENIIELENKEELFFAVKPFYPRKTSFHTQLEAFSVEENKLNAPKILSYRNTINQSDPKKIICENGRSIRFKSNKVITGFDFEFYSDFITAASQNNAWELMGDFALSMNDSVVSQRLDPQPVNNPVHGKWLRYNEEAYVNTANYLNKWESPLPPANPLQGDIKSSVNKYITLSNTIDPPNPKAVEYVDINGTLPDNGEIIIEPEDEENEKFRISHLDMLNIAGFDYHTARMLGLGTLDMSPEVINGESFVYLSAYNTLKDVKNVSVQKNCQLLSMSLPTSIDTQRQSLPIDIAEIKFGPAFNTPQSQNLCDENGYTFDGKYRMVKFYTKEIPNGEINPVFFANNAHFDASTFTLPVYGGLEHRYYTELPDHILVDWAKPELLYDKKYKNIDTFLDSYESVPIMLPHGEDPFYTHRQSQSGFYDYATYGINIFSRATTSTKIFNVETHLKPKNTLLPPSENNAWLIMKEKPLMFTSQYEQDRYTNNTLDDKTLVRISFSYDYQDIVTHKIPSDTIVSDNDYLNINSNFPDEYDLFADEVEIFYKNNVPKTISAGVYKVEQHDTDQLQVIFRTKDYHVASTGETFPSKFPDGTNASNFVGGIFLLNGVSYIINAITNENNNTELYFHVFKKEVSAAIMSATEINTNAQGLSFPQITGTELFTATENMQTPENWGEDQNPNSLVVDINNQWDIHREIIYAKTGIGEEVKYLEKSRGIWGDATVEPFEDNNGNPVEGVYTIRFNNLKLYQHQQFSEDSNSVEFFNGKVRLFRKSALEDEKPIQPRENFKVIKTENIISDSFPRPRDLVLHITDPNFDSSKPENEILTGENIEVNYYPGYCAYLYAEPGNNLVKESVLPPPDILTKYSVFGLRTIDTDITYNDGNFYKSKFCPPILLFGQNIKDPLTPEQPKGVLYATRPDFYGKSTYSFTTKFQQIPFSIQFYRSDDEAILNALYEQATIKTIKENLNLLGGYNESFLTNRWENFFDFDALESADEYGKYPEGEENEYQLPLPDKKSFYEEINLFITKHNAQFGTNDDLIESGNVLPSDVIIAEAPGKNKEIKLVDFIKEAIYYSFVPLTEVPVLYQHIKSKQTDDYMPVNKKQNIRDKYGALLSPNSSEFDMAPMMTKIAEKTVLLTDFTLDGTTDNICFYASREIGTQMGQSEMSGILGPVRLVNSNPPDTPKISKATPVLENKVLGILPKVKVEIQPYPEVQKIDKISLYRCTDRLDAESILSMTLVNSYILSDTDTEIGDVLAIDDELSDFENIPYGDVLYYRVTVARKIQYSEPVSGTTPPPVVIDYAPSQASKIMALVLSETQNPEAPVLEGIGTRPLNEDYVNNVILKWNQTCYKGVYHLYNMSSKGNWAEIARLIVNSENNKAQLQVYNPNPAENESGWVDGELLDIVENKFTLPLNLLGTDYTQFPLFDENNNRKYHHFKVVAENTSNMFSTKENILTLFNDEIWNDLLGISSDGSTNGMIIEKTFIIK